jgi:hypothetical protein
MVVGMGQQQQPIYQPIPYQWVYIHNIYWQYNCCNKLTLQIAINFSTFSFQISLLIVFLKLIHLTANCMSFIVNVIVNVIVNFGFESCFILFCANWHSIQFICSKCLRLT